MQLKVILPSGEVNVPVEPNSTPGHLKENLKYSLRVPPKCIKLTCNGKELVDIKPLSQDPNNVHDGAVVYAEPTDAPAEDPVAKSSDNNLAEQPTMIKKEEAPKKIKPRKEQVRAVLSEGDVVKKQTISPGHSAWAQSVSEGKSSKRQMAYLKLEAVDDKKVYPESADSSMVLVLGDPHTSPVWTAAACQLDIGEKATFQISKKAIDFDPEGLNPTDSCSTWAVELVRVLDVEDPNEDFSHFVHIDTKGSGDKVEDLDRVAVHWRIRRWTAEGNPCIGSSRERMAIYPGYGLVTIEDPHAAPVNVSIGEGQQEAVELLASRLKLGGKGHIYVKTEAMKANRPPGCVIFDVELVALDSCKGPGTPGWDGWTSLVTERETGDEWLEEAEQKRKSLETFGMLRKSTGDSKDAEQHVALTVHKYAENALRRYRRALKWVQLMNQSAEDSKTKIEEATVTMRLAKALALSHRRFGEDAEKDMSDTEKSALQESRNLLQGVLDNASSIGKDDDSKLVVECRKLMLQVCIQAGEIKDAKKIIADLEAKHMDDDVKNDRALLNRKEAAMALQKGAGSIETIQKELQEAVEQKNKEVVSAKLAEIKDLITTNQVTWDTVRTLKVGKDVGNSMKLGAGFEDLKVEGAKVVAEIQLLAQRAGIGL